MHISSVGAIAAVYTGYSHPGFSGGGSSGSTSVIKIPDGTTITTQRGSLGDIVSVTTTTPPQAAASSVDVTA